MRERLLSCLAELLTVEDSARRLGVSEPRVRRLSAAGRLRAEKVGRQYLVEPRGGLGAAKGAPATREVARRG